MQKLFTFDCGTTNWCLAQMICQPDQPLQTYRLKLTGFGDNALAAAVLLDAHDVVQSYGRLAYQQAQNPALAPYLRERFKPSIGTAAGPYSHQQALSHTQQLLQKVLERLAHEKSEAFGPESHYAFTHPVHWAADQTLSDFQTLVRDCFPADCRSRVQFVSEPEAAFFNLVRLGQLPSLTDHYTLVMDVGGGTTDFVVGKLQPRPTGGFMLQEQRHWGGGHGSDLFDEALAREYLSPQLNLSSQQQRAVWAELCRSGRELKEGISDLVAQGNPEGTTYRPLFIRLPDETYRSADIEFDRPTFEQLTHVTQTEFRNVVQQAFIKLRCYPNEIGQVVLVGGGARLYLVPQLLQTLLEPDTPLHYGDPPEETVAHGAAYWLAGQLGYEVGLRSWEAEQQRLREEAARKQREREAEAQRQREEQERREQQQRERQAAERRQREREQREQAAIEEREREEAARKQREREAAERRQREREQREQAAQEQRAREQAAERRQPEHQAREAEEQRANESTAQERSEQTARYSWVSLLLLLLFCGAVLWSISKDIAELSSTSTVTSRSTQPTAILTSTAKPKPTSTLISPTLTPHLKYPDMVFVPAGEFEMGSEVETALAECEQFYDDCNRAWYEDVEPVHMVYLDAFYIDKYEVTNAQYADFLNIEGNQAEGGVTWLEIEDWYSLIELPSGQFAPQAGFAEHPVIYVSWYGAQAYCEWAGKRLPTEAEWEKAARGTDGRQYPWGNEFDGTKLNACDTNCELDWKLSQYDDSYAQTAPVGRYESGQSPYGAYDMGGNVWEWVADGYAADYYSRSPDKNPINNDTTEYRVLRGGSWDGTNGAALAAIRVKGNPSSYLNVLGFRCTLSS